ncbi:alpha-glucan family phosphorylase [Caminibacter sp.]
MNIRFQNPNFPEIPQEINGIKELALNIWWTWNVRAQELFKRIDPILWRESSHNPLSFLKSVPFEKLEKLTRDVEFMNEYNYVYTLFKEYMSDESVIADRNPLPIAYFCAEYGLHHSLPIYSGGLGFLAGDILKEASDMNLPMVGIGFMYPGGYVRQIIGSDGWQRGTSEVIDKDDAPIERVLDENGNHLIVKVPYIKPDVYVSVWCVHVGRVNLFLLDTDIEQNDPWDRKINERLYTPDMHQRLRQEIVLGIGGYAVLERLGIKYSILHLNEGHPAFAIFERIRFFMEEGLSFNEAKEKVKNSTIFTTHTPLQAATDVYGFDMLMQYFNEYMEKLGIEKNDILSLGINPDSPQSGFNMTVFALNMSKYKNAVSKKHQEVSNEIWKKVLKNEKIDYVTNGVHIPTWMNRELQIETDRLLGGEWKRYQDDEGLWFKFLEADDEVIWKIHYEHKIRMMNFIREKVRKKWKNNELDPIVALAEGVLLDPDVFTIVFARRMTEYKRPYLILEDLDRLERIVNNKFMPVQIIFAGKAHPADIEGKKIIQRIYNVAKDSRFQGRIVFVEDYNELVAKYLLRGADLWLNNPKKPLEACGTSGMKASINGTIHCSVDDGWWIEGYNGKNGWKFGSTPSDNIKDANELYDLLENEIVPLFYDGGELSKGWVKVMKNAIASVAPKFSARRMMKDYVKKFYLNIKE